MHIIECIEDVKQEDELRGTQTHKQAYQRPCAARYVYARHHFECTNQSSETQGLRVPKRVLLSLVNYVVFTFRCFVTDYDFVFLEYYYLTVRIRRIFSD